MKFKTLIGLLIGSLVTFFILSLLSNKLTNKEYWFYASIYLVFMVLAYLAINLIRKVKSSNKTDSLWISLLYFYQFAYDKKNKWL